MPYTIDFLKKNLHNRMLTFMIVISLSGKYFTKMNAVYVDIYQKDAKETFISTGCTDLE